MRSSRHDQSQETQGAPPALTFEHLVLSIRGVDQDLASQAKRAVNLSLTIRNWLIGWHLAEYEQKGEDRAQYGEKLLAKLSASLVANGDSRAEERELRRYRRFSQTYPQIREALSPELDRHPAASPGDPRSSKKSFARASGLWGTRTAQVREGQVHRVCGHRDASFDRNR